MLSIATVNVLKSKNILAIAVSVALPIVVGGLALAAARTEESTYARDEERDGQPWRR